MDKANRRQRTSRKASPVAQPGRVAIEYVQVVDLQAYEYNPRDNAKAIESVAASIRAFGFLVPCVVDDANILVCGHTRVEAAKVLGIAEVPCIRATHLNQDQIAAFRLIDNKVAEQAAWDFDLLAGEIGKLSNMQLDWTAFGWSQEEIDCLSDVVSADCMAAATAAADAAADSNNGPAERRAPQQARCVIGEFVFFVPATQYRNWADGIRQLNGFNEKDIEDELRRRLGLLDGQ